MGLFFLFASGCVAGPTPHPSQEDDEAPSDYPAGAADAGGNALADTGLNASQEADCAVVDGGDACPPPEPVMDADGGPPVGDTALDTALDTATDLGPEAEEDGAGRN